MTSSTSFVFKDWRSKQDVGSLQLLCSRRTLRREFLAHKCTWGNKSTHSACKTLDSCLHLWPLRPNISYRLSAIMSFDCNYGHRVYITYINPVVPWQYITFTVFPTKVFSKHSSYGCVSLQRGLFVELKCFKSLRTSGKLLNSLLYNSYSTRGKSLWFIPPSPAPNSDDKWSLEQ